MEIRIIVGVLYFVTCVYLTHSCVCDLTVFVNKFHSEMNRVEKIILQIYWLFFVGLIVMSWVGIFDYITNPHHYSF